MSKPVKIKAIVDFVSKHPESNASRRVCRELLGEGLERLDQEFATELEFQLNQTGENIIDSYYYLIR